MKRTLVWSIALLAAAPVAHANPREVTVSTPHGSAKAELSDYCDETPDGQSCGTHSTTGGPPEVITHPGDTVRIALDDAADSMSAGLTSKLGITPLRLDARTYTFPYPAGALLPRRLTMRAEYPKGEATWTLELVPPDLPQLSKLALKGRRVSIRLSCPTGCTGTLSLRFTGRALVKYAFAGVKHKTLTRTVSRATQRRLEHYAALSARLRTQGRAPFSRDVDLRHF